MINIKLDQKPISVSIDFNGYYKLVLLLGIINYCAYNKQASLSLIHIVFWSLRSDSNFHVLKKFAKQERRTLTPWTFEKGVENVLALGFINDFIERKIVGDEMNIKITDKGIKILRSIEDLKLFKEQRKKIQDLGKISKNRLDNANKNWTLI